LAQKRDFNYDVPLPPGLTVEAIKRAIEFMERELADLVEVYMEQSNVFSALVGIMGTRALDQVSNYEKHRNIDTAQQRFPDLNRRGCGKERKAIDCLERKRSKRPWAIQAHYNHAGWYVVWRYLVDTTESITANRPVIIWRVDIIFLEREDWKYEKSAAGEGKGGRTHTFGVRNAASKLKEKSVYQRSDIALKDGKPVVIEMEE
jgi:hypothetical protein